MFSEPWVNGATGGRLPLSLAQGLLEVHRNVPEDAYKNGMHAWHAGSNAYLAQELGLVGAPLISLGGWFHESPLDWGSFWAEQKFQGTVNHYLDSMTDIWANHFGMLMGYRYRGQGVRMAITLGNHIPGPGDPDPAFGGQGAYTGDPTKAWGQYPK